MKITLLGATGTVGKELLGKCLAQGYEVKALVRSPQKIAEFADKIEVVAGDYFDKDSIAEAVAGADLVISTIGPSTSKPKDIKGYSQSMINAMVNLISAMEAAKVQKIILIGGCATPVTLNEAFNFRQKLIKSMLNLTAKYIIDIKTMECSLLTKSSLDWIIVRPPTISKGAPTGSVKADETTLHRLRIDVSDLSDFILRQILSDEWVHKAPLVCTFR